MHRYVVRDIDGQFVKDRFGNTVKIELPCMISEVKEIVPTESRLRSLFYVSVIDKTNYCHCIKYRYRAARDLAYCYMKMVDAYHNDRN